MVNIRHMTVVKGITDEYASRLSLNLFDELERRLAEGTMSVIETDLVSTTYQNLKPSIVDSVPDADYVYIIGVLNDVRNYYKIVAE